MDAEHERAEVLACPKCKGSLDWHPEGIAADCLRCRLRYRVDAGLPVLLVADATPLD